jgi:CRISPR system Cascade subunit CasD
MQSWGTQSRFQVRDGAAEPSKSGIVGLLCAAIGRDRAEPVDDLARLRMGVRVDFGGLVKVDYQTAGGTHRRGDAYGVPKVDGRPATVESRRYYLADADFLVGLEGDAGLLALCHDFLERPVWPLFLGRKSHVPSLLPREPGGLREAGLEDALSRHPWPRPALPVPPPPRRPAHLLLVLEASVSSGHETRRDQPYGCAFQHRRFLTRYVTTRLVKLGDPVPIRED